MRRIRPAVVAAMKFTKNSEPIVGTTE
jgi:hypothetical protein